MWTVDRCRRPLLHPKVNKVPKPSSPLSLSTKIPETLTLIRGDGEGWGRRGGELVHIQLRGEGDDGARRVHGVHRKLPGDRRTVSPEAAVVEQQVHLLLRPPHLQFPRPRRLRLVCRFELLNLVTFFWIMMLIS